MSDVPIFDQIIREQRWSPFSDLAWPDPRWSAFPTACPICGVIDASQMWVDGYDDPICTECWMCNRHVESEMWHCAECGKYLHSADRHFRYRPRPGVNAEFLCGEHYAERSQPINREDHP